MKVVQHDIEKFVDIGTVVFYTERDFFPEINGTVNGWRVDLAKSRVFMFSSEETSDQLDFAKYDFSYDLPKSDYWQRMDSNVFAYQDTTTQIGPDFDKYAKVLIPQDLRVSERDDEKKFFGRISTASETTYLVRIPKTIQTFSAGLEGNVWKIEVYEDRIDTNCNEPGVFTDFDVLKRLNIIGVKEPLLSIYLGPQEDVQLEDFTFEEVQDEEYYTGRYTFASFYLTEEMYNGFQTVMTKRDYLRNLRNEINSDKLLYICNSSEGTIYSVDLFTATYPAAHNKHKNQPTTTLRNDAKVPTTIFENPYGEIMWDNRNKVLLSTRSLVESEYPLFLEALAGRRPYSPSRKSRRSEVKINTESFTCASQYNIFGENPVYSPWWYQKEEIGENLYLRYYSTHTGKGKVTPGGLFYIRKGEDIKFLVEPQAGFKFSGLGNASYVMEEGKVKIVDSGQYTVGYQFQVIFDEIKYTLDILLNCPNNRVSPTTTYHLNSFESIKIKLIYLENGEEKEYTGTPIELSDTRGLKFRLEADPTSYFTLPDFLKYINSEKYLGTEDGYYVIDFSETPQSALIGNGLSVEGKITNKTYTVILNTGSGIQTSVPKKSILEFGSQYIAKFALDDGELNLEDIKVYQDGKYVPSGGSVWTVSKSDGMLIFYVPRISNNYEIQVNHGN